MIWVGFFNPLVPDEYIELQTMPDFKSLTALSKSSALSEFDLLLVKFIIYICLTAMAIRVPFYSHNPTLFSLSRYGYKDI